MKEIWIKTQTKRSTLFKENISNINVGVKHKDQDFEFGICSVKYWGDFDPREEALITLLIEGKQYELTLSELIKKLGLK